MKARSAVGVLLCSFCGKQQDEVSALIGSSLKDHPAAYICDECVAVCNSILERNAKRTAGPDSSHKT